MPVEELDVREHVLVQVAARLQRPRDRPDRVDAESGKEENERPERSGCQTLEPGEGA